MRTAALQERRNRQILADIVRTYIETGEPVSSRAISKGFEETLSTATIRNVMADLEDGGFLYQPHTSAGRGSTGGAVPFFWAGGGVAADHQTKELGEDSCGSGRGETGA